VRRLAPSVNEEAIAAFSPSPQQKPICPEKPARVLSVPKNAGHASCDRRAGGGVILGGRASLLIRVTPVRELPSA